MLLGWSTFGCRTSSSADAWNRLEGLRRCSAPHANARPRLRRATEALVAPATSGRLVVRVSSVDSILVPQLTAGVRASISHQDSAVERYTAEGFVAFDSLAAGTYEIAARSLGYYRITTSAEVRRGYADTVDLVFEKTC